MFSVDDGYGGVWLADFVLESGPLPLLTGSVRLTLSNYVVQEIGLDSQRAIPATAFLLVKLSVLFPTRSNTSRNAACLGACKVKCRNLLCDVRSRHDDVQVLTGCMISQMEHGGSDPWLEELRPC